MTRRQNLTKYACFITSLSTAITANISPILFLTFHNTYNVSYTLLGLLVVINFGSQLLIDLIYSFFSNKLNLKLSIKLTPVTMVVGLLLYAFTPFIFKNHEYVGLLISTIIFSISGGLAEVLTSPVISALPSKNPERLLSSLHSFYAWGVAIFVSVSTLILYFIGQEYWYFIPIIFSILPLISSLLFINSDVPNIKSERKEMSFALLMKNKMFVLCLVLIILGGATECVMSQWCSTYIEQSLQIDKLYGDLFGLALFGIMLGCGRSFYAKRGKNVINFILFGFIGAFICYLIAIVSPIPVIGLICCALTGLFASMLWPGSLILSEKFILNGGVIMYAIMASGGDFGAGICPQLMGIVTDGVLNNSHLMDFANKINLAPDQFALKAALLIGSIFPFIAIFIALYIKKGLKNEVQ